MKKYFRFLSFVLVIGIVLSSSCVFVSGDEVSVDNEITINTVAEEKSEELTYSKYLEQNSDKEDGVGEIILKGDSATLKNATLEKQFEGKENVIKVGESASEIEWTVNIPKSGMYILTTTYFSIEGRGNDISLSVKINGKTPYSEAESIVLPIAWQDDLEKDAPFETDVQGSDVVPNRVQKPIWVTSSLLDSSGYYSNSLSFYFEKGNNTVTFYTFGEPVGFYNVVISSANVQIPDYKTYKSENSGKTDNAPKNYINKIQAERPTIKSDAYLYPTYEKSDPSIEPYDPIALKRNIIGTNWSSVGQYIEWDFEVPEDGYYKMGVKYRQKTSEGIASLRKLTIDGELYFSELENLEFQYTSKFEKLTFGNEEGEYLFYLTKGNHKMRLEISTGKYAETVRKLDECADKMNELYRKIIMVTGKSPDAYRDYDLAAEIPEMIDEMTDVSAKLKSSSKHLKKICNDNIDTLDLEETAATLDSFIDKPYNISGNLSNFSSSTSTLATFVSSLCSQPLEMDYWFLTSVDYEIKKDKISFFTKVYYEILNFINSFTTDYSVTNVNDNVNETIEVWTSAGREPVNVIKELINTSFTEVNPDINVELKYVHTTLIQGVLAGIEPDVIISVGGTDPVDLAMRGVLEPLDKFNGFEEIYSSYKDTTLDAFVFEGQTYAIPETIAFDMMFVRNDIFNELNIDIPKTWDDFKDISKLILHKNMEVGIPFSTSFYNTLLLQRNYNPYQNNNTTFNVQTPIALEVFKEWTEYYTDLSMSMFKDDFNRFRSGEMPVCIMGYSFYNTLTVGAPEIRGDWSMYPIPGTLQEDGTIDRTAVGSVSGSLMLKASDNKEAAWEFIKWWTGPETQANYGKQIEFILGPSARYTAAHPEAFNNLLWTKAEMAVIDEQWESVVVLPNIPGGYYIGRNIDNAFRATAMNGKNYRESLNYWAEEINKEIIRKRKQYGLDE